MAEILLPFLCILSIIWSYCCVLSYIVEPGPRFPPTKGKVWPEPQIEVKTQNFFTLCPVTLNIEVKEKNCDILERAVDRYKNILNDFHGISRKNREVTKWRSRQNHKTSRGVTYRGIIHELQVFLSEPCEEYPHFDMKEFYTLSVDTISVLKSESVWGILRGLETFSQLFYLSNDYNEIRINATSIHDYPQYQHRGLLLDTGRHYVSLNKILTTIDALSMNKMNVFHWHIVDDESFPYQSDKFPTLSAMGAFHPSMVYTKDDIKKVVEYARDRGVRVIPEIDVPAHTRSWGVAYPHALTKCYKNNRISGLGPLNPINNVAYKVLRQLYEEAQEWFPDKYFHVGGDEVDLSCWSSNPEVYQYMKDHNLNTNKLHALFMKNVIAFLKNGTVPAVWQEVYDEGVGLSKETLIQVWKYHWIEEMIKILNDGHLVVFSSSWYLDYLKFDWDSFYLDDPRRMVYGKVDNHLLGNIAGGEACMWGEKVDDVNVISRTWPRTSAVAERLWSGIDYTKEPPPVSREVRGRMEEHTCRMRQRGIGAQPPSGPGFCLVFS
ncbi:hypothetical protein K1T71_010071 [Dendrolimus kikuchii]|uniref:Uncharacterized protein n=1 Tax=Dendrolimus kikuchii TaxID=765133 RepID=A0ACC1CQQ4_9NEOP|nr:hypothetical protein K1T71_010071 [Dendrolimus kikuchii]